VQPLSAPSSCTDAAGGHVVAGAQDGVVRELRLRGVAAGGGEVGAGFGGQFAAEQGAQARVRGRVADEDAAQQGLGIVRGDDLLVDAAGGVRIDDFEGVLRAGEGVTEAGDVHPGELELGGGVEAREGRFAAVQPVRHDLRHGVRRGHQAQAHAAEVGHLADRPDAGDLRFAAVGNDDAAAGAELEQLPRGVLSRAVLYRAVGRPEQFVAGPHSDRDDHDVGVDGAAVRQEHAGDLAVAVREDLGGEHSAVDGEALGLDQPAERLAG
jgi:hypothetical protein